ncbi:MAG: hypothetical protein JWQ89_3631 [Devosia sp.]|uniref:hypothetical protein n=1 Tax=Devosia sp. TaxID=1871048 RepID=UPI0026272851|nr:hypothetical protein [Devosia sp.]MDB5541904.1 hypothetical protein [Devosia sp.]
MRFVTRIGKDYDRSILELHALGFEVKAIVTKTGLTVRRVERVIEQEQGRLEREHGAAVRRLMEGR